MKVCVRASDVLDRVVGGDLVYGRELVEDLLCAYSGECAAVHILIFGHA